MTALSNTPPRNNAPGWSIRLTGSARTTLTGERTVYVTDQIIREEMDIDPDEEVQVDDVREFIEQIAGEGDLPEVRLEDTGDWDDQETDWDTPQRINAPQPEPELPMMPPRTEPAPTTTPAPGVVRRVAGQVAATYHPEMTQRHPLWKAHAGDGTTCIDPLCAQTHAWHVATVEQLEAAEAERRARAEAEAAAAAAAWRVGGEWEAAPPR